MASDIIVPEVGELGMDVTFVQWLKEPGDQVAVGDPLFEVDTEKSVMVVEAYAAGTLAELRVGPGDTVSPRDVIGRILDPGEEASSRTTEPARAAVADATDQHAAPPPAGSAGDRASSTAPAAGRGEASDATSAGRPDEHVQAATSRVSPRAKRVAKKLGVSTDGLTGTGPEGLVTETDVRAAAESATKRAGQATEAAPRPDTRERTRRAVADLTTSSWQSIPHFFLQLEADVERGLELARPTPLICAAVAQALVRTPECNLEWEGDRPVRRSTVDLGLLVDTPAGLLIAVIENAQDLDLADMADAVRAAADRARRGKLAASDMSTRSLTVSNLGMHAVDRFSAVIPRPDVLTLAVGRTRTAPRWNGDAFVPRRVVDLTLSVDHRALDGAAAARFMTSLESVLADPVAEGLA